MTNYFIPVFISMLSLSIHAQKTISIKEYFPLKNGTEYVYHWRFTQRHEEQKGEQTIHCSSIDIKGNKVYYFDDAPQDKDGYIDSNTFGFGVYLYKNDSLFLSPISLKKELKEINIEYFKVLFPKEIEINKTYSFDYCPAVRKFTCIGFEDIKIDKKVIPHCLKFETEENWPTAQYKGAFWLLEGFGVVKSIRVTGRVEEIDTNQLPNTGKN